MTTLMTSTKPIGTGVPDVFKKCLLSQMLPSCLIAKFAYQPGLPIKKQVVCVAVGSDNWLKMQAKTSAHILLQGFRLREQAILNEHEILCIMVAPKGKRDKFGNKWFPGQHIHGPCVDIHICTCRAYMRVISIAHTYGSCICSVYMGNIYIYICT